LGSTSNTGESGTCELWLTCEIDEDWYFLEEIGDGGHWQMGVDKYARCSERVVGTFSNVEFIRAQADARWTTKYPLEERLMATLRTMVRDRNDQDSV
jgi:hypothetical protein